MKNHLTRLGAGTLLALPIFLFGCALPSKQDSQSDAPVADVHFHISNFAAQGITLKDLVDRYMASGIKRSVVMPVPLLQRWDSFERYQAKSGGHMYGPSYYLGPKSDVYYYAFPDAMYAKEFLNLPQKYRDRLDLMITGFNPMDEYAIQHVKRALLTFPGAFSGIGEFSVHKEIVTAKVAGNPIGGTTVNDVPKDVHSAEGKTSLYASSVRNLFRESGDIGLAVVLHNDIYHVDVDPSGNVTSAFPQDNNEEALKSLCAASRNTTAIWAHTGIGRFVKPTQDHLAIVGRVLDACPNWSVDISWDLVQQVMLAPGPGMPPTEQWIAFLLKYQDRVLWGSDTVIFGRNKFDGTPGPDMRVVPGQRLTLEEYASVITLLDPIFKKLPEAAVRKIRFGNYERIFDGARAKVRAWEHAHASDDIWDMKKPDSDLVNQ
jgi:hypothetical protein